MTRPAEFIAVRVVHDTGGVRVRTEEQRGATMPITLAYERIEVDGWM